MMMSKTLGALLAGAALLMLAAIPARAADERNTVAFVPQLVGIPYFDAMEAGGKKAAGALGAKVIYSGPDDTHPVAHTGGCADAGPRQPRPATKTEPGRR